MLWPYSLKIRALINLLLILTDKDGSFDVKKLPCGCIRDCSERHALKVRKVSNTLSWLSPWIQITFMTKRHRVKYHFTHRFKHLIYLIKSHLCTLRFKCCSECGSCKHRHKKTHRWREQSHGENCVHSPPTPTAFDPNPTPLKCVRLCAGPNRAVCGKTLHAGDFHTSILKCVWN